VVTVLNADHWRKLASASGLDAAELPRTKTAEKVLLQRIAEQIRQFPGYAQVRRVTATLDGWTVDNNLLTPTMKLKRAKVMEKFNAEIDGMYAGH
jgi:long-chain acyl-CoA synthetase